MPRRSIHLLCTLSVLLSQAEAFYVTPWTRISHPRVSSLLAPRAADTTTTPSFCRLSMVLESSTKTIPSNNLSAVQVEKTIVKLGRRGHTDKALELYHSLSSPTLRQLNSAIDACSRARPTRLNECFRILQEGISHYSLKPNVFTFGALMSACSRAHRADKAIQVLRDMEVRMTCMMIDWF